MMQTIATEPHLLTQEHWTPTQTQNTAAAADLVQRMMNDHDFDYVLENFQAANYVQHNRNIPDGIPGVVAYVKNLSKRFPEYGYDVKRIFADGDDVIFHSHATLRKKDRGNDRKGFNIIDIWKFRDGEIIGHWDAVQPLDRFMRFYVWMTGGAIRNANGVF